MARGRLFLSDILLFPLSDTIHNLSFFGGKSRGHLTMRQGEAAELWHVRGDGALGSSCLLLCARMNWMTYVKSLAPLLSCKPSVWGSWPGWAWGWDLRLVPCIPSAHDVPLLTEPRGFVYEAIQQVAQILQKTFSDYKRILSYPKNLLHRLCTLRTVSFQ